MPACSARRAMAPMHVVGLEARVLPEWECAWLRGCGACRESARARSGGISVRLALYSANSCHACDGRAAFEDGGDVLGGIALRQLPQHVVEDVDGFGGKPGAGAHGRRGGARARVVGAEDEAEGIDQEETRASHSAIIAFPESRRLPQTVSSQSAEAARQRLATSFILFLIFSRLSCILHKGFVYK